jgi:hypothetical protein
MMNKKILTMLFGLLLAVGWTSSASAQALPQGGYAERLNIKQIGNSDRVPLSMVKNHQIPFKMVEKKTGGARNILILGVASVVIALTTSLVSLYVYHKSGDIYLDCSLPDADCPSARSDSEENNRSQIYVFQDSGDIDEKVLEEYLKEIETPINRVKKLEDPFGGNALSDESLGI